MRCGCGRRLIDRIVEESSTAAHDPDVAGVGSSYHLGDVGGFLFIPQFSDRDGPARESFRLIDPIEVAAGETVFIVNLRLYLTIAQVYQIGEGEDPAASFWVDEREVVTPGWRFSDGNVSWHLRTLPGIPQQESVPGSTAMPSPSVSSSIFSGPAARLTNPAMTETAYGGVIPGHNVGSLGTMRDKRFLWTMASPPCLRYRVDGPASIVLYASVLQTDPDSRAQPEPTEGFQSGEAEENFFLRDHPLCQYRHIGGAVMYEREARRGCRHCGQCGTCCDGHHDSLYERIKAKIR